MLILTRRVGESLTIGDDIKVRVTRVRGQQQVQLGILAPDDVPICREEIAEEEPTSSDEHCEVHQQTS